MSTQRLHWMASCRRAVVRESIGYSDLMQSWLDNLQAQIEAMRRWYGIEPAQFQAGRGSVVHWMEVAESVAAARDTVATLDAPAATFYVRLWKGPLRVLLEQKTQPAPLGKVIVNPTEIEFDHGGPVRMKLNDNGEMINFDARFLM